MYGVHELVGIDCIELINWIELIKCFILYIYRVLLQIKLYILLFNFLRLITFYAFFLELYEFHQVCIAF